MNGRDVRPTSFAARPRDPEAWVASTEADGSASPGKAETYPARLTIDVTTALRGRIKIAAFRRGLTVADMLRALLDEAYPEQDASVR